MKWMRLFEWENLVISLGAILLILVTLEPEEEVIIIGSLQFDVFYVFLVWFGVLALSSVVYLFRSSSDT